MRPALPRLSAESIWRVVSHRHAATALGLALAVAVGWQSGRLLWRALPDAPAARPPAELTSAKSPQTTNQGDGRDPSARLASVALFGTADQGDDAAADADAAPADAPETQLNLSLKGVYAAGAGEGLAIITSGSGDASVFSVGDAIAGNARITGIFGDRVVLRRNGRAETLRMPGADDGQASTSDTTRSSRSVSEERQEIARRASELRRRLIDNPGELARLVRFQPHIDGGELVGYKIQPREADAGLLRELGIRPSDIVTRVNGRELNDPREANKVLQDLRDAQRIELTFIRDGQQQQLSVPIGQASG